MSSRDRANSRRITGHAASCWRLLYLSVCLLSSSSYPHRPRHYCHYHSQIIVIVVAIAAIAVVIIIVVVVVIIITVVVVVVIIISTELLTVNQTLIFDWIICVSSYYEPSSRLTAVC